LNRTRLTLKQQLMLNGENQTANAGEPQTGLLKTFESDS
jgi:hypothetical protein